MFNVNYLIGRASYDPVQEPAGDIVFPSTQIQPVLAGRHYEQESKYE
ncbi:hypothetical protein SAE02_73400 [Skermanella aerolata]|uniref:Uncharacterized protein n=1 Tax=Skermanella aerolata TaxID=393310 RepID=A0A512E388_9PROT|nr:hypothetical protein SAE02_73400 [Skermanella aerolata]